MCPTHSIVKMAFKSWHSQKHLYHPNFSGQREGCFLVCFSDSFCLSQSILSNHKQHYALICTHADKWPYDLGLYTGGLHTHRHECNTWVKKSCGRSLILPSFLFSPLSHINLRQGKASVGIREGFKRFWNAPDSLRGVFQTFQGHFSSLSALFPVGLNSLFLFTCSKKATCALFCPF